LRLDAGTERGALFGAPLFGATLGERGARDELRGVASTESIAAIRSAWVMPAMSTAGMPALGGGTEPATLTAGGTVDGVGEAAAGATLFGAVGAEFSPFVPVSAGAGLVPPAVSGASPLLAADGAVEFVAFGVDSGVASGARRTT
jgi:hypothetical protein